MVRAAKPFSDLSRSVHNEFSLSQFGMLLIRHYIQIASRAVPVAVPAATHRAHGECSHAMLCGAPAHTSRCDNLAGKTLYPSASALQQTEHILVAAAGLWPRCTARNDASRRTCRRITLIHAANLAHISRRVFPHVRENGAPCTQNRARYPNDHSHRAPEFLVRPKRVARPSGHEAHGGFGP